MIFITGDYPTIFDATALQTNIRTRAFGPRGIKIDKFFRFDQPDQIIDSLKHDTFSCGREVVCFSFGVWAALLAIKAVAPLPIDLLIMIDGVHFPNPSAADPLFDLSDNVLDAETWFQQDAKTYFSRQIGRGKFQFQGHKFNTTAGTSDASRHGEIIWRCDLIVAAIKVNRVKRKV